MDKVILLHGIGRTSRSLERLEAVLQDRDYNTLSITYPSRRLDIAANAAWLRDIVLDADFWNTQDTPVHFICHSMGGLVLRHYLHQYRHELPRHKIGRVIVMGTPFAGSPVADCWHKNPLYKWFYGPAGQQLTTAHQGAVQMRPYYDLGVIAGTFGWFYIDAYPLFEGPHDGRVSVESTRLEGLKDHVVVPASHTFMMNNLDVQAQIFAFLKNGAFTKK